MATQPIKPQEIPRQEKGTSGVASRLDEEIADLEFRGGPNPSGISLRTLRSSERLSHLGTQFCVLAREFREPLGLGRLEIHLDLSAAGCGGVGPRT